MSPDDSSPTAVVSFGCSYTQAAVTRALTAANWRVLDVKEVESAPASAPPSLWWADFSAVKWDDVLSATTCASTQYVRSGVVRKAELLHYMKKHGSGARHPPTLVADIEDEDDIDDLVERWTALCENGTQDEPPSMWLLKPSRANRGEGIAVLLQNDETSLRTAIASYPQHTEWLLQRYVLPLLLPAVPTAPPLALPATVPDAGGLKFHLRWHVLTVGALSAWVHDAPLVLLSSMPWRRPDTSLVVNQGGDSVHSGDEDPMLVHLTNHAQQVRSGGYDEAAHTRSLDEAFEPPVVAALKVQARAVAAEVFAPFVKGSASFFALPHCFEIFGFDFAVDTTGRMWLLEVNSGPDLSLHGSRLAHVADRLLGDAHRVVCAHMYRGQPEHGVAAAMGEAGEVGEVGDHTDPRSNSSAMHVGEVLGGFECVLNRRCDDPRAELERFKRSMATIGRFAHALHEAAGAPVRGVQARAKALQKASSSVKEDADESAVGIS